MTTNVIEVMSTANVWQDITSDVLSARCFVGFREQRQSLATLGTAQIVLNNATRAYTPALSGVDSGVIDNDRRIRIRRGGSGLGKCLRVVHSGPADTSYWSQVVNNNSVIGDVFVLSYEACAEFDSMYNADQVYIVTSAEAQTPATKTYTNKWKTYTVSFTTTINATTVEPRFRSRLEDNDIGTTTGVRYRNITLKKNGGANLLTNGDFATGSASPWAVTNGTASQIETSYASSNVHNDIFLNGAGANAGGVVGTISYTATGVNYKVGNAAGVNYWQAQQFENDLNGKISQWNITWGPQTGTPEGPCIIEFWQATNAGDMGGMLLGSLEIQPQPDSVLSLTLNPPTTPPQMTCLFDGGAGVYTYVVVKPKLQQASGNYWTIKGSAASVYAGGQQVASTDNGATWATDTGGDLQINLVVANTTTYQELAQSFTLTSTKTVDKVKVLMRNYGRLSGQTITLRIETNSGGNPSGSLVDANATATISENTVSGPYPWGLMTFDFTNFSLAAGTYHIRMSTTRATNSGVSVGSDWVNPSYANGSLRGKVAGVWGAIAADMCFEVWAINTGTATLSIEDDYYILFNGKIIDIKPAPHNYGPLTCTLSCADFVDVMQNISFNLALQSNQRADQLNATLLAKLPQGSVSKTLPGSLQDTARTTFANAFDGYVEGKTMVYDAILDSVKSDYGQAWIDRDGTFRFVNSLYPVTLAQSTPDLTLTDGMDFVISDFARGRDTIINNVALTWHPRDPNGAPGTVLAKINSTITIPAGTISNPGTYPLELVYTDDAGKPIGGKDFITPVATIDYTVGRTQRGTDYTNSPTFSVTNFVAGASKATMTLNNFNNFALYASAFKVRGTPVERKDPLTEKASDSQYTQSDYSPDLPHTSDDAYIKALASYLVYRYRYPAGECRLIRVDNETSLNGVDLFSLDIMDLVKLTDAQTGLSNTLHAIVGIEYTLDSSAYDTVKSVAFVTERLDPNQYWILGTSALDTTTILYL